MNRRSWSLHFNVYGEWQALFEKYANMKRWNGIDWWTHRNPPGFWRFAIKFTIQSWTLFISFGVEP